MFTLTQELHDKFREKFNATCCRILTKSVKWCEPKYHKNYEQFVSGSVEILVDILEKSNKESDLNIDVMK